MRWSGVKPSASCSSCRCTSLWKFESEKMNSSEWRSRTRMGLLRTHELSPLSSDTEELRAARQSATTPTPPNGQTDRPRWV